MSGVNLGGAKLTGAVITDLTGTPQQLPSGWNLTDGSITPGKANQTVTFGTAPTILVNGTGTTNATSSGPGTITYTSTDTNQCTTDPTTGLTTGITAGTNNCTITATAAATTTHNTGTAQQTISIGKANQTVTFTTTVPASPVVGDPGYSPAATASPSGLTVTFNVSAAAATICSIDGSGLVTFITTGDCVIEATQAGNSSYNSAASQQTIAITPNSTSCAAGGICVVGDTGPGGGKVFYVADATQTWGTYMEVPSETWNSGSEDPSLAWGTDQSGNGGWDCSSWTISDPTFTIFTSTAIGAGRGNTKLFPTGACDTAAEAPAVFAAIDYNGGGKTDWFLPSKDELHELYLADIGAVFNPDTDSDGWSFYWSSSQVTGSAVNAWAEDFLSGAQVGYLEESSAQFVRPIRAF